MIDPIGTGVSRPAALGPAVGPDVTAPASPAAASPERWLGELPAAGGPIVGAPLSARSVDVDEAAARVVALLGHPLAGP